MLAQALVQLDWLYLCDRDRVRYVGNAVPEVLYQLDAFRQAQPTGGCRPRLGSR
jgi:hypothetical protein